jgi:hypothetical protein
MHYQEFLRDTFPLLARLYRKYRLYRLSKKDTKQVFDDIYKNNSWKSSESVSGAGSTMESTAAVRSELPGLLKDFQVNTFLDLPCGDFNWMKTLDLPVKKYIGGDIVQALTDDNNSKYSDEKISFRTLNLLEDELPEADMLLCRDCLVHLSFGDIVKGLRNIKKGKITFLLTTTFPNVESNEDIITGRWRRLNLQKPPFSFPAPKVLIEENGRTDIDRKCLALWMVNDIKLA